MNLINIGFSIHRPEMIPITEKIMDKRPNFQIKPGRFSVGMIMEAGPIDVWRIITDTSLWPEWGPSVLDVKCNDRFILYGSKGSVRTVVGFSLSFTITSLKKEREWRWAVGGVNATGHRIIPINADCCMLFFDMPIWAIPYSIICLVALNRIRKLVNSIGPKMVNIADRDGKPPGESFPN